MREPGELIQADDYAFAFRRLEPVPDPPRALLVLLHGVGGDEMQMARLGAVAPDGMLVVLPRGHRSISGGSLGWYRVGMSDDGPQLVEDELHEARAKLVDFLAQLQRHHDVPASRTYVAGFSQGGILAACTALTTPGDVAGFAMFAGRLPAEIEPLLAPRRALDHLRALVVHGRGDDTLPVDGAIDAVDRLSSLGITAELHLFDGGHALDAVMDAELGHWLRATDRETPHVP